MVLTEETSDGEDAYRLPFGNMNVHNPFARSPVARVSTGIPRSLTGPNNFRWIGGVGDALTSVYDSPPLVIREKLSGVLKI